MLFRMSSTTRLPSHWALKYCPHMARKRSNTIATKVTPITFSADIRASPETSSIARLKRSGRERSAAVTSTTKRVTSQSRER